jgi:superfamily II DNA or RNA helicase
VAEQSSQFLAKYLFSRNVAFTATPAGRSDNTDIRMEGIFGEVLFYLPYWEAVELGLAVPIRVEWHDVLMDHNPAAGKFDVGKKRWGLWRNAYRNQVIADAAGRFGPDEQVMVLVDTIEHAVFLRQHLEGYTLVFGPNEFSRKDMYLRREMATPQDLEMPPRKLNQLREQFEAGGLKKVIATGVWAVGIDAVRLTAVGRANSGSSEIMDAQAPGRVARTYGDKTCGVVLDLRDQFDANFHTAARKRFNHYQAMRWEQVLVTPQGAVPLQRFSQ